jgi:maltose 6'-phosphate phosphatase
MRASLSCTTVLVVCILCVCLPCPSRAASPGGHVRCTDVIQRGVLNVLTLNMLFSDIDDRTARFERIATFVHSQAAAGNPVDVLLLQEAAGGRLVQTENSAQDFQALLNQHEGLHYTLRTAYANGVPGLLVQCVTIR